MAKVQKQRASKTSLGVNGGGGKLTTRLTPVQRVLLGGGQLRTIKSKMKNVNAEPVKKAPDKAFINSIRDCEAV